MVEEYDVTICGTTKKVTPDVDSCTWTWTGTSFTGCGGASFDRIVLELTSGGWIVTCDEFMGASCAYVKEVAGVPTGKYFFQTGSGATCEATATVVEST